MLPVLIIISCSHRTSNHLSSSSVLVLPPLTDFQLSKVLLCLRSLISRRESTDLLNPNHTLRRPTATRIFCICRSKYAWFRVHVCRLATHNFTPMRVKVSYRGPETTLPWSMISVSRGTSDADLQFHGPRSSVNPMAGSRGTQSILHRKPIGTNRSFLPLLLVSICKSFPLRHSSFDQVARETVGTWKFCSP